METIKNLQSILVFEKVAAFQSYSKAAKELGVSKAYVSKSIQKLEDELGQRLLNRSTRVVKLTHLGEAFFKVCQQSIFNIQQAQNSIVQNANMPQGKIRITLAGAFGEDYITPFVAHFIKKYPEVKVELSFEEKFADLVRDGFDLAIRVGELEDSSLIAKKIAQRKHFICATPEFLKKHKIPKHPKDLKEINCLIAQDQWSLIVNGKRHLTKVKSNFKSNSGRSILSATLAGLGISMLPGVYVKQYLKSGELICVLDKFAPQKIPIWAIVANNKNMPLVVRYFLDELGEQFKDNY